MHIDQIDFGVFDHVNVGQEHGKIIEPEVERVAIGDDDDCGLGIGRISGGEGCRLLGVAHAVDEGLASEFEGVGDLFDGAVELER